MSKSGGEAARLALHTGVALQIGRLVGLPECYCVGIAKYPDRRRALRTYMNAPDLVGARLGEPQITVSIHRQTVKGEITR